uniref:Uncharacterized protein n=1 Tax=Anguilla anguilla TaxID=7936 RepID=A0A0E9XKH5_ANGAN
MHRKPTAQGILQEAYRIRLRHYWNALRIPLLSITGHR